MSKKIFSRLLLALLLLCGLGFRAEAVSLSPILQGYWSHPSLELANGNKIALGKLNHLHAVFTNQDPNVPSSDIWYADMQYDEVNSPGDPYVWSESQLSYDGFSSEPAVAAGSDGLPVVVWVSRACATNPLGAIYYSRRTSLGCPTCWTQPMQIVALGSEPSIAIDGTTVHLAWTTGDRVQYASFPTNAPPAMPLWMGEVVDFSNCPGTRFHQPAIAFAHPPCDTVKVKIAALFTSNEQATVGTCHAVATQSGPRVYERDANTQAWSTAFQEVTNDQTSNQPDPVAVSISLSANRITGDFFLAWSDEQNQAARTRVGHGLGTVWDASQQIDSQSHHVHVAAKSGGSRQFRLALSGPAWSTGAYTQTGKWNGGVTWTGPTLNLSNSAYPLIAHPQALYWRRCAGNTLKEMTAYTEASGWNLNYPDIAIDPTTTGPVNCFIFSTADVLPLPPCFTSHIALSHRVHAGGGDEVLVDLGDTAVVTKVTATGAEITTVAGGTIQATWNPGEVLYTWENGFAVVTQRDSVRFASRDAKFQLEDLGALGGQTGAK